VNTAAARRCVKESKWNQDAVINLIAEFLTAASSHVPRKALAWTNESQREY
jgi:hypothetical protein